jgi:ParB family chromosome partitioning protein
VIKALALATDPPKRSGSPKKSGIETVTNEGGKPILRVEGADKKGIRLTLLSKGGASRAEAEKAIRDVLDQHWT